MRMKTVVVCYKVRHRKPPGGTEKNHEGSLSGQSMSCPRLEVSDFRNKISSVIEWANLSCFCLPLYIRKTIFTPGGAKVMLHSMFNKREIVSSDLCATRYIAVHNTRHVERNVQKCKIPHVTSLMLTELLTRNCDFKLRIYIINNSDMQYYPEPDSVHNI